MKAYKDMTMLERVSHDAQTTANRNMDTVAVFNLNMAGKAMYVIRDANSFPGENRMVAGPFLPQPAPYRYDYDRLSGTGIIVRISDDTTSLRYTGEDALRLLNMDSDELADEAAQQDFD